jgi:hypothetical protein
LAERQCFAAGRQLQKKGDLITGQLWSPRLPEGLRERLDELVAFKKMGDEASLADFVRRHKISWYILRPESKVAWPTSFLESSVYNSGGYRVYHFTP